MVDRPELRAPTPWPTAQVVASGSQRARPEGVGVGKPGAGEGASGGSATTAVATTAAACSRSATLGDWNLSRPSSVTSVSSIGSLVGKPATVASATCPLPLPLTSTRPLTQ